MQGAFLFIYLFNFFLISGCAPARSVNICGVLEDETDFSNYLAEDHKNLGDRKNESSEKYCDKHDV